MNRDMHHPNTNNDDVAFLFRNKLMPVRSEATMKLRTELTLGQQVLKAVLSCRSCVNRCLPACLSAYKVSHQIIDQNPSEHLTYLMVICTAFLCSA